jgi:chromosome segregation ATPase
MPERAHVTSVEALEAFRASLVLYASKARPALEEVSADVLRTKLWLQDEQRAHWEGQVRRRAKALEQAKQALSTARLSSLGEVSSAEQMAVHKAKRALEEAEEKLKILKYWNREFENRVEPLVKQLQKLHTFLAYDMVKAAASLTQTINTLAAYAEGSPGGVPSAAPTSAQPAPEPSTSAVGAEKTEVHGS